MNLARNNKLTRHSNAVAVGTSAITPASGVDMQNFESCLFVVAFGTITDGPPSIEVHGSSDDGVGDAYAALVGTNVAVLVTDDNKLAYVEIEKPLERYLKCVVNRGGATGAVLDSIVAIQGGRKKAPTTHDATVAAGEVHVSPAAGTA